MEREKKRDVYLIVFLIIVLFLVNYSFLDRALQSFLTDYETAVIVRVIDGDTVVLNNGERVRLLGIDAPEIGELYADESTKFLENRVLNKTVYLEYTGRKYDRYERLLAYIHADGRNVNLDLVKNGLANYYSYDGKDKYHNQFIQAWEECLESNMYICERSKNICSGCIELREFNHGNEIVTFYNQCSFNCDLNEWELRDEGRKSYFFDNFVLQGERSVRVVIGEGNDTDSTLYWEGESFVWAYTGDTLFLRDEEGKLALWEFIEY